MFDDGVKIAEGKLRVLNVEPLHAGLAEAEQKMNKLLGSVAKTDKYSDFVLAALL